MEYWNLAVNAAALLLLPIILWTASSASARRTREYTEVVTRLERMENGLLERIGRIEGKIDGHLTWHIADHRSGSGGDS